MSMLSSMSAQYGQHWPVPVTMLYATKPSSSAKETLFLERLLALTPTLNLELFLGSTGSAELPLPSHVKAHARRVTPEDVQSTALGSNTSSEDVCFYVCGPQKMTDYFVDSIKTFKDIEPRDVMCEKWW